MKRLGCFVAVAFLLAAEAKAITVVGAPSCGQWIEDRASSNDNHFMLQEWLLGYLSGLALGRGNDVLKTADAPSIHAWMDNYCRAHPLEPVSQGGLDLFYELKKRSAQ